MTHDEFSSEVVRLSDTFGKTSFATERVKLIWLEVQDLSHAWFGRLVNEFIGDLRHAPLLPDFKSRAQQERAQMKRATTVLTDVRDASLACSRCRGTGDVVATRIEDRTNWAFKCQCTAGRLNGNLFPLWDRAKEGDFELWGCA